MMRQQSLSETINRTGDNDDSDWVIYMVVGGREICKIDWREPRHSAVIMWCMRVNDKIIIEQTGRGSD